MVDYKTLVDYNKRREKIIEFISKNVKCTKATVIRYMNKIGFASDMTTHRIIKELENEKIIRVLKDKPNSQVHYLIMDDDNEFNIINSALSQIEIILDNIYRFLPDFGTLLKYTSTRSVGKENKLRMAKFNDDLFDLVKEYFDATLKFLLIQTYIKVFDPKNTAILYKKIVGLILRIGAQFWDAHVAGPLLSSPPRNISQDTTSLLNILNSDFFQSYVNEDIDVSLMQDTVKNLEKFDNQIQSRGKSSELPTLLEDSLWRMTYIDHESYLKRENKN